MHTIISKSQGLIAAPFTPFHADRSLNLNVVERQVEFLAERGVTGAFVCGTTGEGISLSVAERMALAQAWKSAVAGTRMKVIVHVGHSSTEEAKVLATHAEKLGVDGIALMPSSLLVPDSLPVLIDICAEVAAVAPGLPFYYYHIPSLSKAFFKVTDLLEAAQDRIPNLAGCKFTHEDIMDYSRARSLSQNKFDLMFGRDEMLLASLVMGAEAWVGSTYNFAAPLYLKIIAAYQAGEIEEARKYQLEACEMIQTVLAFGGLPAMKALCNALGLPLGPVRVPMTQPKPEQIEKMLARLEQQGFMPYFQPVKKKDRVPVDLTVVETNGNHRTAVAV